MSHFYPYQINSLDIASPVSSPTAKVLALADPVVDTVMQNLHPDKTPQVHHVVAYKDYLLEMRLWLHEPFHRE